MSKKNITQLIVGPIETNCWIYPLGEKEAAIIDPGDEAERIILTLKKLSLVPKFILLTHGHFDHIAAVPQLAGVFAEVSLKIAIHRLDADYLGGDAYKHHNVSMRAAMGSTEFLDALWNDMPPADHLLDEGVVVGPFTVLHLPGHTQGSVAFWDKEENALFSGDTLFEGNYGRTDLPGGSEEAIFSSLRRLFAMDADIDVYPGHGRKTRIGREVGMLF
jgi:glyoxylase-like metal-dependent hydrolase (beta-lactamase superfamily II)